MSERTTAAAEEQSGAAYTKVQLLMSKQWKPAERDLLTALLPEAAVMTPLEAREAMEVFKLQEAK